MIIWIDWALRYLPLLLTSAQRITSRRSLIVSLRPNSHSNTGHSVSRKTIYSERGCILTKCLDVLQANGIVPAPEVEASSKVTNEPTSGNGQVASQFVSESNEWAEMDHIPETVIVGPKIQKKRKIRVTPEEKALSGGGLDEPGATSDAELRASHVRPPSIISALDVVDSSKDISKSPHGER